MIAWLSQSTIFFMGKFRKIHRKPKKKLAEILEKFVVSCALKITLTNQKPDCDFLTNQMRCLSKLHNMLDIVIMIIYASHFQYGDQRKKFKNTTNTTKDRIYQFRGLGEFDDRNLNKKKYLG